MTSTNSIANIQVYVGIYNLYYTLFGNNYDIRFPIEYALCAQTNGGLCEDCLKHGFINGVFVGFCANCIDTRYGLDKGNGMEQDCVERSGPGFDSMNSIWETYMKTSRFSVCNKSEIGCEMLNAKHIQMLEQKVALKQKQQFDEELELEKERHLEMDIILKLQSAEFDIIYEQKQKYAEQKQKYAEQEQELKFRKSFIDDLRVDKSAIIDPESDSEKIDLVKPTKQISVSDRLQNSAMLCGNN